MTYFFSEWFKKILFIFLGLTFYFYILFQSNVQSVLSLNLTDLKNSDATIVEYIKLSVSKEDRKAWLSAEINSWEPWLKKQEGFIERRLFWDPNKEEALLLISWASRSDWKNIPQSEIDRVQSVFEEIAMDLTNKKVANPFPIKSQGEFLPQ